MSVFFRSIGSNNVFHFFEDPKEKNKIKTVSYHLDSNGKILDKWEKNGTIKQLIGAINSCQKQKTEIISNDEWKNIISRQNVDF
jgi:hypothetical protein